ncbi:hypothetical protein ABZ896_42390 [Streptomyces sp. NPDC047072]|uniref:hypothetical protein n=1 Tax=Streptomyces sp. NPDC047072 TaxID=3154809 RepID=UPI00340BECF4
MTTTPRAACAADDRGRITFGLALPDAEGQQVLLRLRPKTGQPEKTVRVLDMEATGEGHASAVLDADAVLEEGRWDVFLLRGSERTRLRPGHRDLRELVDGHLREWPSPLAVRIPYVTKDGYLAIRTWLRPAHAEAGRVDVTDRTLRVEGLLHGAVLRDGAEVLLRVRGAEDVVRVPLTRTQTRAFSFGVDHEQLGDGVWNVFVRPAPGAPPVRLARLLDDVADRKSVFVYPSTAVGDAIVRPYYTLDNDLSVEVKRAAR